MEDKETNIFQNYLSAHKFKHSKQRKEILDIFLSIDRHLTAEELCLAVKQKYPSVGFATVYRTLKLLCATGLCRELKLESGPARYEHLYGHRHHDHLICTRCGRFVEVVDPEIEKLQERLSKTHGFLPQEHRMELYGICRKCRDENNG
ncbi:MAG: transcriptional repressor [Candidatus Omnitrophica bacterium]|nr:transcriptional repressor [Candidatus Omnitrophota bacterium]